MNVSGKLVILSILFVALLAAGISWWFRFHATHRAAEFWGPEATLLIRDAPVVELIQREAPVAKTEMAPAAAAAQNDSSTIMGERRDISDAHGLIHFRNAILEDRSYEWLSHADAAEAPRQWAVRFTSEGKPPLVIWFSPDWKLATREERGGRPAAAISSLPISHGLEKYFNELRHDLPAK